MAIKTAKINDLPAATPLNDADVIYVVQNKNGVLVDSKAKISDITAKIPPPVSNYNSLSNKPSINNVPLQGNKTLGDLGIENYVNNAIAEGEANLETPVTTAASAQGAINPTATAYQGSGTMITQTAGLSAGTRSLQNLLDSLVNLSHSHSTKAMGSGNCAPACNCNCNCGSS